MEQLPVPNTYADLFYAYTAVWTILAVYIGSLVFRLNKLERKLNSEAGRQNQND